MRPCRYSISYFFGFFPLFFMIVPPGILLNLAFGAKMATAENCESLRLRQPVTDRQSAASSAHG